MMMTTTTTVTTTYGLLNTDRPSNLQTDFIYFPLKLSHKHPMERSVNCYRIETSATSLESVFRLSQRYDDMRLSRFELQTKACESRLSHNNRATNCPLVMSPLSPHPLSLSLNSGIVPNWVCSNVSCWHCC